MATSGEFNSLSRILSEGAEQAVGLAVFHNWSSERIDRMISRRFGPLREIDRAALLDLARNGVAAADLLNRRNPAERIEPGDLPTNPFLFGQEREGRRGRAIGTIEFPESGQTIRVYLDFPDFATIEEMIRQLVERGGGIGERYPRRFGLTPGRPVEAEIGVFAFIEKAF